MMIHNMYVSAWCACMCVLCTHASMSCVRKTCMSLLLTYECASESMSYVRINVCLCVYGHHTCIVIAHVAVFINAQCRIFALNLLFF